MDRRAHGFTVAAIEPDRIRQVRRALQAITLTGLAVARHAVFGKHHLTGSGLGSVSFLTRDLQHILGHVVDLGRLKQAVDTKARHLRVPGIRVFRVTDAMGDGRMDRLDIAAPDPVIVQQVGIAARLHAGAARVPGKFRTRAVSLDSIRTAAAAAVLGAPVNIPVHYDGWAHFTEGRDAITRAFDDAGLTAALRIADHGTWLSLQP